MLKVALVCSVWHSDSKAMRSCSLRKDTAVEILSLFSSQNSIYTSLRTFWSRFVAERLCRIKLSYHQVLDSASDVILSLRKLQENGSGKIRFITLFDVGESENFAIYF